MDVLLLAICHARLIAAVYVRDHAVVAAQHLALLVAAEHVAVAVQIDVVEGVPRMFAAGIVMLVALVGVALPVEQIAQDLAALHAAHNAGRVVWDLAATPV